MLFNRAPLPRLSNYIQKRVWPPRRSLASVLWYLLCHLALRTSSRFLKVSFSFPRVDQAGNTAGKMQGGFFHSCTPGDAPAWSPAPEGAWPDPRSCRGFTSPPLLLRFQNRATAVMEKSGAPRKPANREGGLPPPREAQAAALGGVAEGPRRPRLRTRPPGSRLRPELRRCPMDDWREGHPRPEYQRPPGRRRRGRCCYRTALSGSGTSSSGGH